MKGDVSQLCINIYVMPKLRIFLGIIIMGDIDNQFFMCSLVFIDLGICQIHSKKWRRVKSLCLCKECNKKILSRVVKES